MRAAIILSLLAHIAVLQWVLNGLPSSRPVELSTIEALPVDLVPIGEVTDVAKGIETAEEPELREVAPPWPTETPSPVAPEPAPTPPPEQAMTPPEPEPAPVAEPEPIPPLEMAEPEPKPIEQAQAEPAPPEPEPVPEPPPPEPEPAPPPPEPSPPAPPVEKVEAPQPDPAPVPKSRPKPRVVAQANPAPSDLSDKIAALLDQQKPAQQTQTSSIGSRTGHEGAAMTQTELNVLAAKMRACWSPPLGATGADELRTVVLIRLNRDGSLAGSPLVVSRPPGRYETTAPESVVRAIGRCAPYDLPSDKYAEWQEIEFDFYPTDMF